VEWQSSSIKMRRPALKIYGSKLKNKMNEKLVPAEQVALF